MDSKEDSNIEPNENKRMIIYFVITNGMVREDRMGMLKKSDIYLDFLTILFIGQCFLRM